MRCSALAAIVLTACAGGALRAPQGAATPSRHVEVRGSATERNTACVGCHAEIAGEWSASLHRQAASDPVYQRAFAREPIAFCTRCHAPEGDGEAIPAPTAVMLGTACVTCHTGRDGLASTTTARPCADCHEFAFPDGHGKMQLTATEHQASTRAATACTTCHMPRDGGHANHRFAASHDDAMLRRAAWITATREEAAVVVTLSPRDIAHALPTGDIFRRLRLTVTVAGDPSTRRDVLLGRKTKLGDDRDDRPFADGRVAHVRVAITAPGKTIAWRVAYERVEHPTTADESDALVDGSVELASGTL